MKIEILGTGCPKCKQLYENTKSAVEQSGQEAEIIKVEDIAKITDYAVMMIPALVIDGVVKSTGKVLSADEIKEFLI